MNDIKVSVVMPVYNMQAYIGEAIESILGQTLKETEIICMDDCGTDDTAAIIKEYCEKYPNVRYFSMEVNSGAGMARATAMTHATGEYLAFMDADDRICRKDALEILYQKASEGNCDVCGGFVNDFSDKEIKDYPRFRELFDKADTSSIEAVSTKDLDYSQIQDDFYFQGFIYKREYLEKNNITFPEIRVYEDPVFLVRALYFANCIRVVNIEYYGHRFDYKQHNFNVSHGVCFLKGTIMNLEFAGEHGLTVLYDKTLERADQIFLLPMLSFMSKHDKEYMDLLMQLDELVMKDGRNLAVMEYIDFLSARKDLFLQFYKYKYGRDFVY